MNFLLKIIVIIVMTITGYKLLLGRKYVGQNVRMNWVLGGLRMLMQHSQPNMVKKFLHNQIIFKLNQLKKFFLNNNASTFSKVRKSPSASNTWKNILDRRNLLQRGLTQILDNSKSFKFCYAIWMKDSLLFNKIVADEENRVNNDAKVVILLIVI